MICKPGALRTALSSCALHRIPAVRRSRYEGAVNFGANCESAIRRTDSYRERLPLVSPNRRNAIRGLDAGGRIRAAAVCRFAIRPKIDQGGGTDAPDAPSERSARTAPPRTSPHVQPVIPRLAQRDRRARTSPHVQSVSPYLVNRNRRANVAVRDRSLCGATGRRPPRSTPIANEPAEHDSAPQVARNTRTRGAAGKMCAGAES